MCTKCPIFLSDCRKISMFSTDFNTFFFNSSSSSSSSSVDLFLLIKVFTVQFHGIPVYGSRHGTCDRQEALFASMRARLERQRAKTGTVKWSVTVLLFCHVNAVVTGNCNCQYSASTCVGKRQGFPSFVCRTDGCKSVCIRKVLRTTDRPTDSAPVFSPPLSYRQMQWRCQRFDVFTEWYLCSLRNLNLSRWASQKYTNYCSKSEINSAGLSVRHSDLFIFILLSEGRADEAGNQLTKWWWFSLSPLPCFVLSSAPFAASDVPPFCSCVKVNAEV